MLLKHTEIKTGEPKQENLGLAIGHPSFLWKQEMLKIRFNKRQKKMVVVCKIVYI